MDGQLALLLALIDEAYDKRSWHGTNLRGSIRGIGLDEASWRPGQGRHNIWENVVHAAYWKYAVRRRILQEKRSTFALRGSNWFLRPEESTENAWKADVELLRNEHLVLRAAVADLHPRDLRKAAAGATGPTVGFLLRGIAAHDLYHAGQIQLLKRLRNSGFTSGI
jgi:hypothetical protein